jgi:hypothetical protein
MTMVGLPGRPVLYTIWHARTASGHSVPALPFAYTAGSSTPPDCTNTMAMTLKLDPNDLGQSARTLLAAIKVAGVDLSTEPDTPGKLWRALAANGCEGLTEEFLAEIRSRREMDAEQEAVANRFDATGKQRPADLGFLLLGLFCVSPVESFEMADDVLALLHAKNAGRMGFTSANTGGIMSNSPGMLSKA